MYKLSAGLLYVAVDAGGPVGVVRRRLKNGTLAKKCSNIASISFGKSSRVSFILFTDPLDLTCQHLLEIALMI